MIWACFSFFADRCSNFLRIRVNLPHFYVIQLNNTPSHPFNIAFFVRLSEISVLFKTYNLSDDNVGSSNSWGVIPINYGQMFIWFASKQPHNQIATVIIIKPQTATKKIGPKQWFFPVVRFAMAIIAGLDGWHTNPNNSLFLCFQ